MALHVQRQMVRAREAATARDAFEWLRPRVFAVMPRQFIWSGETPVASLPAASVRLLTYENKQHISFQMIQDEIFLYFTCSSSSKWPHERIRLDVNEWDLCITRNQPQKLPALILIHSNRSPSANVRRTQSPAWTCKTVCVCVSEHF